MNSIVRNAKRIAGTIILATLTFNGCNMIVNMGHGIIPDKVETAPVTSLEQRILDGTEPFDVNAAYNRRPIRVTVPFFVPGNIERADFYQGTCDANPTIYYGGVEIKLPDFASATIIQQEVLSEIRYQCLFVPKGATAPIVTQEDYDGI